jgi:hypothetical protein
MRDPTEKELPCGCCSAGVYAYEAIKGGLELFGQCQTRKEALRSAPRCSHRPKQICMGARDFIVASTFPIDVAGERAALGE